MRISEGNSSLATPASSSVAQPRRQILFRVLSANADIASVRYRAIYPTIGLRDFGFKCSVSDQEVSDGTLRNYRCIVFVKAFRFSDLNVALRAKELGVPIVLDLCDNIFVQDYGPGLGNEMATAFKIMAASASAIVTTGPALASVIRQEIVKPPPIVEICDPLETKTLLAAAQKIFRAPHPFISPRAIRAFELLIHEPSKFAKVLRREYKSRRWFFSVIFGFGISLAALRIAAKKATERIDRIVAKLTVNSKSPDANPQPLKTLLWFGNHGAPYGDFGMLTLLPVLPAIIRVAKKIPLRLIIVSNSEEKYRRYFSNLPFSTKYREWNRFSIFDDIEVADVCLIPNSRDTFSRTKSSNRAILSLYCGTPVVATDMPALQDIKHCIATDDWENGILTYLVDPEKANRDISNARSVIEKKYYLPVVAQSWADLLNALTAKNTSPNKLKDRQRILIMACGALSAEVLISTFNRLKADPNCDVDFWMATEAIVEAPRVADMADATSTTIFFGTRKVLGDAARQSLDNADTVLIAAEELVYSSIAQAARIARQRNIFVCAVQSKMDVLVEPARVDSDTFTAPVLDCVLIWGDKWAPAAPLRNPSTYMEISVGCPREIARPGSDPSFPLYGKSYLAVVEDVYRGGSTDRRSTVEKIDKLLEAFPNLQIVLVPRPTQVAEVRSSFAPEQLQRLTVVDLDEGKNQFRLPRILADAAMVITESSIIALDTARTDRPIAMISSDNMVAEDMPLAVLNSTEEWIRFVADVLEGRDDPEHRRSFVTEIVSQGDPVDQILAALKRRSCSTPKSGIAASP